MSAVVRIQFTVTIRANPAVVWHHITAIQSYKHWTSAFADGSYFEGTWDLGSRIQFLSPSGDGMVAEIAERRQNEFISIRHLGFIANGIEDTSSDAVTAWAPAYENYTLLQMSEGTKLVVDQDVAPEWQEHLSTAWPKALDLLKDLCESQGAAPAVD